MIEADFEDLDIVHFTAKEIEKTGAILADIDEQCIMRLDRLRGVLGLPIGILHLTTGLHAENSFHYRRPCGAVDFKIICKPSPHQNKVIQHMLDCGFTGCGVYDWGYHGDLRWRHALWKRVNEVYYPLVDLQ